MDGVSQKPSVATALRGLASAFEDAHDAEPVDSSLRVMARVMLDELARMDTRGETTKATSIRVDAIEMQLRKLRSEMQALRLEVVDADPIAQAHAASALEKLNCRPRGVKRVYFIQQGDDGPIKIGFTVDVRARLSALQTSSPHPLRLLHEVPGDEVAEREWHTRFAHIRLNGEWFRPDQELLTTLALLRGEVDSSALEELYAGGKRERR